ncbi:MAG TPA: alkaline phosphatase family protein, partial [Thermoplasmata archaeon]|nr:alkaline phosphatase family protein [Thermoplasmata archaeon]
MERSKRVFAALAASALLLLLSLTVVGSNASANLLMAQAGNVIVPAAPTNNFDQFVIVLMENHDISDIYGPAPYMTQLADQNAFSQHWASITNPSQPNYIALIGGSTFGVSGDGNHPNLNYPTLVDIIENSGHSWNAIAEGSGSGCSINPNRGEDHFPFLSYTTITGNTARCANLHSGGPTDVVAALNAGTSFIWFTPNDSHNMHDNSVASGDSWLQSWVPGLLSAMAAKHATLFITYDEGYASPPLVYSGFSGPSAKQAYKSTTSYTHYSLLKLIEDVWGGGNLGQGDVNAASPVEFFGAGGPPVPDFSIAANPGSVSFIPSQSGTSTITLTSTGGFTGSVALSLASAPAGVTGSCAPSSISGSQASTCTLTGTTAGSYAVTVTGTGGSLVHTTSIVATVTSNPPPGGVPPGGRNPLLWPFSRDSIWNLPIGSSAVYVPANIQQATQRGMTTDPDVIILTPNATVTAVYYNADGWSGGSRCTPQGNVLFDAPIPDTFVVPGAGSTNPDGTTPNYATAILMPDGHTLSQGQPFARCTAGGPATMWWSVTNDLYGTGIDGGHGGSGLSSLGGTIRFGELVPGGVIRHVMKINLYGLNNYYYDGTTHGYRWPASQADGCASSCYAGTTPALRMGSLLGIPASVNIDSLGLETEPAKILARALQDYGAYTVDDTAWSVYAIATEFSPQGRIDDEFNAAWGFPINPSSKTVPWARDMDRLFGALNVVDNWDAAQWAAVSASSGAQGAGGGAPRVPWAPDFGTGTPGPSEPAAPGLSFPRLPAEWLPAVVGPGVALGLLLIAFVISRRSERTRRHKSAGRNNR